jgi:hypothetical protein
MHAKAKSDLKQMKMMEDLYALSVNDIFETQGLTFQNFYGVDIPVRIDAAVEFTTDTTDSTTNVTCAPHVLLKTSLGDMYAFADGTYNDPAFQIIADQIPAGKGPIGQRAPSCWGSNLQKSQLSPPIIAAAVTLNSTSLGGAILII